MVSGPKASIWSRKRTYVLGGLAILLIAAAAAAVGGDDAADNPPVAARSTAAEADPDLAVRTILITPPDEAGYLDGVRVREAAAADQIAPSTLVDFGLRSCALRDGYIMGSRPTPTDRLAQDLADEIGNLDPGDVASAVANAAQGRLCDVTVEEAS